MIRLFLSGLLFYWRSHLGVLLGVILGCAVLTGSLLVGDSVDGSLRKIALQRLGSIEYAMHTPNRFFSTGLADRMEGEVAAALHLRGMALGEERQVNQIQILGCDSRFWHFADMDFQLLENEVALNQKLAESLEVNVGDEVSLRIEKPGLLPRDAPLSAQNDDRSVRGRFTVVRILSHDELGRFSLTADQAVPYNAFVNLHTLAERTELIGKANLLVVDRHAALPWKTEDFGLRFREEGDVVLLESDGIYLEPEAARAAMTISGAGGTLTYLVNSISTGGKSTPYSFMIAHDGAALAEDEVIINRWLADQLQSEAGDSVEVNYFELLPDGRFEERTRTFVIQHVAEMKDVQLEQRMAPAFPGLTDVDRCADWDVGIPMEEEQLEDEANEAYWNAYKQTPKAIVSLAAGQAMWSNRFGNLTGVRWTGSEGVRQAFMDRFNPADAGYVLQPVREQALSAVEQAMDFGQLFVGMSFFLIVAALLLTGLLFVFGVQQRAEEMGILLASGWRIKQVRRLYLLEGAGLSLLGSVLGSFLGIGYTKMLIAGLSNHWKGAIANSAIEYFGHPDTVLIGALSGFICAVSAIAIACWRQAKQPARNLLMADFSQELLPLERNAKRGLIPVIIAVLSFLGAVAVVIHALSAPMHSVTMPFFGAGALLLVSGVLYCGVFFRREGRKEGLLGIGALARRNIARRPGRSLSVVSLLACGTFLVFAVSSMKEDVTAHADEPWSGSGGFAFFGESTLPIMEKLGAVRLRVRDGDDASCLNLNRVQQPRLLGVDPQVLSERGAFFEKEDIWPLLRAELPDNMIPALVGDSDTAMWGLEAKTGIEDGAVLDYVDEAGNTFKVKLVGQLPMRLSVFQGTVLISEEQFVKRYPGEEGYRMFLMDEPEQGRSYERAGLNCIPSTERLLEFYAVESTYLAMFLVLGVFGLAVGSMGMGVVVFRNVQDRRAEIGLLCAVGYSRNLIKRLLFMEHGLLMAAGLSIGLVAAIVAMVPSLFISYSKISPLFIMILFSAIFLCGLVCTAGAVMTAVREDMLGGLRNE